METCHPYFLLSRLFWSSWQTYWPLVCSLGGSWPSVTCSWLLWYWPSDHFGNFVSPINSSPVGGQFIWAVCSCSTDLFIPHVFQMKSCLSVKAEVKYTSFSRSLYRYSVRINLSCLPWYFFCASVMTLTFIRYFCLCLGLQSIFEISFQELLFFDPFNTVQEYP